mgnify:CR=1 FL=1
MSFFSREIHTDHNPRIYFTLTRRHFKVFFKNKIGVFFALLVPMITLIIYIIFLRQLQTTAIDNNISIIGEDIAAIPGVKTQAHLIADAWMLSGIIAMSCISVSLNTCTIMINDRIAGVTKDFVSSPISRRSITTSYFLFNVFATFLINFCVLLVAFIYLGCVGGFHIAPLHAIALIPILFLSVLSASLITCFVASFISSYNVYNSTSVIISSAAGFLIGAYMPISMLPESAQRIPLFFPGTYSAGLLRTFFIQDYLANFKSFLLKNGITADRILEVERSLSKTISLNIDFFGHPVTPGYMVLAILVFVVLFMILDLLFLDWNLRAKILGRKHRIKRHKK